MESKASARESRPWGSRASPPSALRRRCCSGDGSQTVSRSPRARGLPESGQHIASDNDVKASRESDKMSGAW